MRNTPHLQRSNAPIREGIAVTICGKKIPKAVLLTLPPEVSDPRDYPRLCNKCHVISGLGTAYEGVVVPGEESLHDPEAA